MLDKVKLYLRVEKEFTEEDELIKSLIAEGKAYCKNAIGYVPKESNPVFEKYLLLFVANAYDNRELTNNSYERTLGNLTPLLLQLKYCDNESDNINDFEGTTWGQLKYGKEMSTGE